MSDEFALFAVLGLIYVTDCFIWVGKDTLAFVSWFGRRWRDKPAGQLIRTSKGGLLLLNPFPPLGHVACCHLPPLSISPTGICSLNGQALIHDSPVERDITVVLFKEIRSVKIEGLELFVNEERFCKFKDARQAETICALLKALRDSPMAGRKKLIRRFWDEQFDFNAARILMKSIARPILYLKGLCNVHFIYLFILAPIVVLYGRMGRMLVPLAIGMLLIAIQISIGFYIMHKRRYPDSWEDRISGLVKMILCPPVSIRAGDLLTEHLMGYYNPLVVGRLLLPDDLFMDFTSRTMRTLKYPPYGELADRRAGNIIRWQNHILMNKATGWLKHTVNFDRDVFRAPKPNDISVRTYCPRCLCQFTDEEDECPDCLGVKRRSFKSAKGVNG